MQASQTNHGTTSNINLTELRVPFQSKDIEWRVQRSGMKNGKGWVQATPYINARAVQDRLDDVCGPNNWRNEYQAGPAGGVLAGISIKVNDEWVTKWDGAGNTDVESVKGGLSDALKRAAVQWGIGRYLYKLESQYRPVEDQGDNFIVVYEDPKDKQRSKKMVGYWNYPLLPDWAKPIRIDEAMNSDAKLAIVNPGQYPAYQEPEVENPTTGAQIIKIKTLYAKAGANQNQRDRWLKTIVTQEQAEQAIRKLEAAIERQTVDAA